MTDPVRAKLSERIYDAILSIVAGAIGSFDRVPSLLAEVSALEARLAAAEGLVERWRKVLRELPFSRDDEYGMGKLDGLRICADELSAILKGEGK